MKRVMLLAASVLVLTAFIPEQADAQRRGGFARPGFAGRGFVGRPAYVYRRGWRGPGWGVAAGAAAVGLGLGALAAAPYYNGCVVRQQVVDPYTGFVTWQWVNVC